MDKSKLIKGIEEILEKKDRDGVLDVYDMYIYYDSLADLEYLKNGKTARYEKLNKKAEKYFSEFDPFISIPL